LGIALTMTTVHFYADDLRRGKEHPAGLQGHLKPDNKGSGSGCGSIGIQARNYLFREET
jgi:hypothetical protein